MDYSFKFLKQKSVKILIDVLRSNPKNNFKFVGGCVRDSLLGIEIKDVDIASPLLPEGNIAILKQNNIKVLENNIRYGVITAIVEHIPFEITTLRKDIKTFGRHAEVAFSSSFEEDAERRDLTINALYLDPFSLEILDYFNGIADIKAGTIRFIGETKNRIKEDYLRILRYFRFYSYLGKEPLFESDLIDIKANASGLLSLSKERISYEFNKILASPKVLEVLELFNNCGINILIDSNNFDIKPLENLLELESTLDIKTSYLLKNLVINYNLSSIATFTKSQAEVKYLKKLKALYEENKENILDINNLYNLAATCPFDLVMNLLLLSTIKNFENKAKYFEVIKKYQEISSLDLNFLPKDIINFGITNGEEINFYIKELKIFGYKNSNPKREKYLEFLESISKKS